MKHIHLGILIAGIVCVRAHAQSTASEVFSAEQVTAINQSLHTQASTTRGPATQVLSQHPAYYTTLVCRENNGEVEMHKQFDEVMIILEGKAVVTLGGEAQGLRVQKEGELRGTSIRGGSQASMEKGAVIHIPANTPHQVFVPEGGAVSYIDVKIAHPQS